MKEKQLKIGGVLSYVALAFNIISGLIYTPWMVMTVGESSYGIYTLANSLITLFLVDFGLSAAVSRYVAKYRAEGDTEAVNRILGAIYKIYLVLTAALLLVLAGLYPFLGHIYGTLTPSELADFRAVYIVAAAFAVVNFPAVTFNGILNSYERFIELKAADIVYRALLIIGSVIALLNGVGIFGLVTVHAIVGLLLIAYKWVVIRQKTHVRPAFRFREKGLYKEIFTFSVWITVSVVAQRLIFNITPSILGIVAGTAAIAVFGVVTTVEGYTYAMTGAINGMFIPKVSRIYADGEKERALPPLLISVGKFQFALNGLIVVGFAVVGRMFITLWVGDAYADAYVGLLVILSTALLSNSLEIANTALIVENKVRYQAYVQVVIGLVNVTLSFVFSYLWGAIGACVSIGIAYTLRAVLMHVVHQRVMKLPMRAFIKSVYLRLLSPILITAVIGVLLNAVLTLPGWWDVLVKGGAVVLLYSVLVAVLGLSRAERQYVLALVRRAK